MQKGTQHKEESKKKISIKSKAWQASPAGRAEAKKSRKKMKEFWAKHKKAMAEMKAREK